MSIPNKWYIALTLALLLINAGHADEGGNDTVGSTVRPSADELAHVLANPIAPVASIDFKLQYQSYKGDLPNADDQTRTQLLFQPVLPFSLANGDYVLFRPAVPVPFDQPVYNQAASDFDSEGGLGDISFDLVYGRTTETGQLTAFGVVSSLPTATNDLLGSDSYTLGPEFLIGKKSNNYLLSFLAGHQWDIGGSSDKDTNLTTMQAFGIYLPGDGWSYGSTPVISYDHITDQWTLPLNFVFSKTIIANERPWKLGIGLNYFIEQASNFGPDWMVSFNITPVFDY